MFIEMRTYTLRPGSLARFWEIQAERGFDVVRPIMERLVCYFGIAGAESDRIVHLWRYDSHEDWMARLHGLYGKPELDAYFPKVRALMTRQHNAILAPAPLPALTPLLGNGKDWLPSAGPWLPRSGGATTVAMETIDFLPGTLPAFWSELASALGRLGTEAGLIGTFVTAIGRQHRVFALRTDASAGAAWESTLKTQEATIARRRSERLTVAPLPEMAPLFAA